MSQPVKRDADAAFDGAISDNAPPSKRHRRRKSRKSSENENTSRLAKAVSSHTQGPQETRKTSQVQDKHVKAAHLVQLPHNQNKKPQPKTNRAEKELAPKKHGLDLVKASKRAKKDVTAKKKRMENQTTKKTSAKLSKSKETDAYGGWLLSRSSGGMFIDQDPILTEDDQHLILPTHSEVQVYATKTSLLVRRFLVDAKSNITSCALSTVDPKKLYVSNSRGLISLWNWSTGAKSGQLDTRLALQQVIPLHSQEEKEIILLLREDVHDRKTVTAYRVDSATGQFSELNTVLQRNDVSPCIKSYAQGNILVASAEERLLIGLSQGSIDGAQGLTYTWREVQVSDSITCFDAQVNSGKSKTSRKVPFFDVVIGLSGGAIVQYEDILFKLVRKEKNSLEEILARQFHWHRTAVNSVKWSRDRNYIISGGNETVLVIWQLDSNQRQYLPHLSTPIVSITVSATGSAYVLRLGDNSVMVLSTADLLPSANVTGLALGGNRQKSSPIVLHPTIPSRLLAAIPTNATVTRSRRGRSTTLLQVYDVESNLQFSRQALTRNMTTASNVGPAGQLVKEPSVTHIDISHDGKWLATVDEWQPNEQDLESMYIDADGMEMRCGSLETSLRLWSWNEDNTSWELVTRIDEPHTSQSGSVLGLSFNPVKLEVATIGSDATIRIWSPKARHRNGVSIRNSSNEQLFTWTSSRTIKCTHDAFGSTNASNSATLAYSDDGSVLAASWSWVDSPNRFVHLIDPTSGKTCASQSNLVSATSAAKLAFKGRHLICLSQKLAIFDILTGLNVASVALDSDFVPPQSQSPFHLATNNLDGTIALGISRSEKPRVTKLVVLSLLGNAELKPVFSTEFAGTMKGLLALTTRSGYLLVDERNRYRYLRPTGPESMAPPLITQTRKEIDQVTRSLDGIFGGRAAIGGDTSGRLDDQLPGAATQGLVTVPEDAAVASSSASRGLDAVLRIVSSAQALSPAELFQRVVGVVGRE